VDIQAKSIHAINSRRYLRVQHQSRLPCPPT